MEPRRNVGPAPPADKDKESTPAPPAIGTPEWAAARRAAYHQAGRDEILRGRAAIMAQPIRSGLLVHAVAAPERLTAVNRSGAAPASSAVALAAVQKQPAINNPKVWEADIRPDRRPWDLSGFLRAVGGRARVRVLRKVKAPTLERIAQVIAHDFTTHAGGPGRKTWKAIATAVGVCVRTVASAIRWFERQGLFDTMNVILRRDGFTRRAANLYRPRMDVVGRDPADCLPEVGGMAARIARMSLAFGLPARPRGLNTSPLRDRSHRPPD